MQTAEQVRLPEVPPGAPTWGPHPGGPVQGTLSWGVCHAHCPPPQASLVDTQLLPLLPGAGGLGEGDPEPLVPSAPVQGGQQAAEDGAGGKRTATWALRRDPGRGAWWRNWGAQPATPGVQAESSGALS